MTIELSRAKGILDSFKAQHILVVGDLMLDRYIYGSASRISPEAPVPVVHVTQEKSVPGGAANVAANIRSLGGRVTVAGILGRDAAAAELKELLSRYSVGTGGVLEVERVPTTVKTRVIAERQQVVRIDWEDRVQYTAGQMDEFCDKLSRQIANSTGVILEDYGKGVIEQRVVDAVLAAARRAKVPVGLDPKENHELNVAGITVATPNRKEAFIAARKEESNPRANPLDDENLLEVGRILVEKWKPDLLIITLGAQGMLLVARDRPPKHVPTRAREVFDVSGAGDTVIGACVLALAAGAGFDEAAELANYAAGVVVGKLGTATCSQEELLRYLPEK